MCSLAFIYNHSDPAPESIIPFYGAFLEKLFS